MSNLTVQIEAAIQETYESARMLGIVVGYERIAKILREESGSAYARGADNEADTLRQLSRRFADDGRKERWEWNEKNKNNKAEELLRSLGEPASGTGEGKGCIYHPCDGCDAVLERDDVCPLLTGAGGEEGE